MATRRFCRIARALKCASDSLRFFPCIGVRPAARLSAPAWKTRPFPSVLRAAARSTWDVGSRADTAFRATRPRTQSPRTEEWVLPAKGEGPRAQHTATRAKRTQRLVDGR